MPSLEKQKILGRKALNFLRHYLPIIQREVVRLVEHDPRRSLDRLRDSSKTDTNQPLRIDRWAEDSVAAKLQVGFNNITIIGEESLTLDPSLKDLREREGLIALVDVIDGTDLLMRDFSNWCSAVVLFCAKPVPTVLASLVCDANRNAFFAHCDDETAFYQRRRARTAQPLSHSHRPDGIDEATKRMFENKPSGPSVATRLADASVHFYGQRPAHLFSVVTDSLRAATAEVGQSFRIYNLGGIPMMVRVANGTADAVFRARSSKPHDVVAGAFIAQKAGAFFGDLEGEELTATRMAESMMTPDARGLPYILAATEDLYRSMLPVVREASERPRAPIALGVEPVAHESTERKPDVLPFEH